MNSGISVFWNVGLVALTWAVSAAFNYGIISEKLRNMKESIDSHALRISRLEDNRYNDLKDRISAQGRRLDKIE